MTPTLPLAAKHQQHRAAADSPSFCFSFHLGWTLAILSHHANDHNPINHNKRGPADKKSRQDDVDDVLAFDILAYVSQ